MKGRDGRSCPDEGLQSNEVLVSVIVPAFNAVETLSDTLDSVLRQTYRAIEVIVIDDGSTDGTAALALGWANHDARLRVISTVNRGVAAARNRGAAEAAGEFIACIDADDLWHPTMIEKCLAALTDSGPRTGFCYAFFRRIDMSGRVMSSAAPRACAGFAFNQLLMNNFVGNGSGIVMRRQAFADVGGYDASLRAAKAQGAEDWLIQCLIALRWKVAVVPEYLVGYRRRDGAMSGDSPQMHRSMLLTLRKLAAATPGSDRARFRHAEAALLARMSVWTMVKGRMPTAVRFFWRAAVLSPQVAYAVLQFETPRRMGRAWRSVARRIVPSRRFAPARDFCEVDPTEGAAVAKPHFLDNWIRRFPEPAVEADRAELSPSP